MSFVDNILGRSELKRRIEYLSEQLVRSEKSRIEAERKLRETLENLRRYQEAASFSQTQTLKNEPIARVQTSEPIARVQTSEPIARVQTSEPIARVQTSEPIARVQTSDPPATIESQAQNLGSGHRLVWGVAGAGKTAILVAKAKMLSEQNPHKKILVTCFNVVLAAHLRNRLSGYDMIEVFNFHKVIKEHWNINFKKDLTPAEFGESVINLNKAVNRVYDVILIDEAQDFDPTWFTCLLKLIKDNLEGDFMIFGDGLQGIYETRQITWKSLGIQAQGRTLYLKKNYRNSVQIAELASSFALPLIRDIHETEAIIKDMLILPQATVRSTGIKPLLIGSDSTDELIDTTVNVVQGLLAGTFDSHKLQNALNPNEIAVMYPAQVKKIFTKIPKLVTALNGITKVQWVNDPGGSNKTETDDNALKVSTIHSAKGLQFKAVIIFCADVLPIDKNDEVEGRKLLYVGMTRAEDILVVTYSGISTFVDELEHLAHSGFMNLEYGE